jgi:mono/diheme cytochrome c family protein
MTPWHVYLATLIALSMVSAPTGAQELGSAGGGAALAKQVCARCHAVQKQQAQSPNEDAPSFQDITSAPGITAMALSAALQTSHRTMPNLVLDSEERADIIAYILSLR